ncbi:MAG: hypothetical protein KGN16_07850 [Burkholderiales bacterium]|nr:hypothetical protein [Burkholderiales bacterium]
MPSKSLSREEFVALGELAKARRMLLVNMFSGTQLKFGNAARASTAKDLLSSGKSIASDVKSLVKGGAEASKALSVPGFKAAVEGFVRECADVDNIHDVIEALGGEVFKQLIAEVTPVIGVLWSAKKLAEATKVVVEDARNLYKHGEYRKGFRPGDPLAAADAIKIIIERDIGMHSVDLARQATVTGAKIAGLFADFGTATTAGIGLGNTLATLGLKLFALGLDIKDMRAGNRLLAHPDALDATVFAACPILGCYLLTCADTSSVANLFVADIGLPGWMDKVEKLKAEKMDPLLKIAAKAIDRSHLQLDGLQSNKGTYQKKGFFARVKARAVKKVFG